MGWCIRANRWGLPLALLLGVALGCVSPGPHVSRRELGNAIRGPGAIFSSIHDAAADALAWCYIREKQDHFPGRVRAGTIEPAGEGYTYGEVAAAPPFRRDRVDISLRPSDVAHFRFYPSDGDPSRDRTRSQHAANDRSVVDQIDPLHRASYLLTPKLDVVVYLGQDKEWKLGKLADWAQGTPRWGRRGVVRIEDIDSTNE